MEKSIPVEPERIRTFGLFGHSGCGKTTLGEAIIYLCKENTRVGRVDDGTSILDYDPDEMERRLTITLSVASGVFKGYRLNLVDTPGYYDFMGDVYSGLRAVDSGVVVVDATTGVEFGTELVFNALKSRPRLVFVNKLGKEHADFSKALEGLRQGFKGRFWVVEQPLGTARSFKGLMALYEGKAFVYEDGVRKEIELPSESSNWLKGFQDETIELAADLDEAIMERYLEGAAISQEEVDRAIRAGILRGEITPVLLGDAYSLAGVDCLLDFIIRYLPSPLELRLDLESGELKPGPQEPLIGIVFKTISEPHLGDLFYTRVLSGVFKPGISVYNLSANGEERINQLYRIKGKERYEVKELVTGELGALVKLRSTRTGHTLVQPGVTPRFEPIQFPAPSISMAIVPKTRGDEEKVSAALARLHDEDPTFCYRYDTELHQQLIHGLGELHLSVILERLRRKFGVAVELERPRIPYRETVVGPGSAQGKYKKQTGGHGQYGDVWLRLEPLPRGQGYEFKNEIFGGAIPAKYIPSVEKGVGEAMAQGVLAGYPVVDLRATVHDGSFHPVDSSDIAFKIAAQLAFRAAAEKAGVVLLEPIAELTITVPEEYMGDVIGDLNARRGRILGMSGEAGLKEIKALVPQAELFRYSTTLRSITQGRGYFTLKLHGYEEVPREISSRVVEAAAKRG